MSPLAMFSFGDIVSIVGICNDVRRLLSGSAGASQEYQDLILELDITHHTLSLANGAISAGSTSPLSSKAREDLEQCVRNTGASIRILSGKIEGFQQSLRKGGSDKKMRDLWRKFGWGFFKKMELEDATTRLREQREQITALLTASTTTTIIRVASKVDETHSMVREIQTCVSGIPHVLGYAWEGGLNPDNQPNDFLGQSIRLPLELCRTWKKLKGILMIYFEDRPGLHYIQNDDFELSSRSVNGNRDCVDANGPWHVHAGSVIDMVVVLHAWAWEWAERMEAMECPRCQCERAIPTPHTGTRCETCRIEMTIDVRDVDQLLHPRVTHIRNSVGSLELPVFKRVKLIFTLVKPRVDLSVFRPLTYGGFDPCGGPLMQLPHGGRIVPIGSPRVVCGLGFPGMWVQRVRR